MKTNKPAQDNSKFVQQRDKVNISLKIKERNDLTDRQKDILNVATSKESKCIFIDGLYGSGKTYLAVLASLRLLNDKKVDEIIFIRNPVESSSSGKIGFIPGDISEKMAPYNSILFDKLAELLPPQTVESLKKDGRISCYPVGYIRGKSWNCKAIIVDEASSMSWDDLFLILTRCGEFSKIFLVGDSRNQNDIGSKSGFRKMFDIFADEESFAAGISCFELNELEDIIRSKFLKFILVKTGLIKKV